MLTSKWEKEINELISNYGNNVALNDVLSAVNGNFFSLKNYPLTIKDSDEDLSVEKYLDKGNIKLLYLHIPFCEPGCTYCSFNKKFSYDFTNYIDVIVQKIRYLRNITQINHINTVYIGGGTPSILDRQNLEKILQTVNGVFANNNLTIHIECDPSHITSEKVNIFSDNRIGRISLGVQSFSNDTLKILGRRHTKDIAEYAIQSIQAKKIPVGIDLILGYPGYDIQTHRTNLSNIKALKPDYVSSYRFSISRHTKLGQQYIRDYDGIHGKLALAQQLSISRNLLRMGYREYSAAKKFSLNTPDSYNHQFTQGENVIGIGPGAISYVDGVCICSQNGLKKYIASESFFGPHSTEKLKDEQRKKRYCVLNLKLGTLSTEKFKQKFECDIPSNFLSKLETLTQSGLLEKEQQSFKTTELGSLIFWKTCEPFFDSRIKGERNALYF